jgi:hypothetical protein
MPRQMGTRAMFNRGNGPLRCQGLASFVSYPEFMSGDILQIQQNPAPGRWGFQVRARRHRSGPPGHGETPHYPRLSATVRTNGATLWFGREGAMTVPAGRERTTPRAPAGIRLAGIGSVEWAKVT